MTVNVTSATLSQHWAGKGLSINDALDLREVVKDYFWEELLRSKFMRSTQKSRSMSTRFD